MLDPRVQVKCRRIIEHFKKLPSIEPFASPVDWEGLGLTDYPKIVQVPMDLSTIESNFYRGSYRTPAAFAEDMRLMFNNCILYNDEDSVLFALAQILKRQFEKLFKEVEFGRE